MNWHRAAQKILISAALACICSVSLLHAAEPAETRSFEEARMLWKKGYYLHLIGDYEKAIALFSKSIDLHPTAEAYTFRGWSLSMLGRIEDAIAECKLAIELDPDYGNPYNDIGTYLIDLDQPEAAIPWLQKAIEAKRYCCYQFAHYNLGRVLLMLGRVAEARQSLIRSLEHDPQYQPPRILLESIHAQGLESI